MRSLRVQLVCDKDDQYWAEQIAHLATEAWYEAFGAQINAGPTMPEGSSDIFGRMIREHNLITDPLLAENGALTVPARSGLGVEIDRDALERFARREFSFEL